MQHPAIQGGREIPDDKKWSAQYLHLRYESSDEQFDLLIALLIRMDIILLSTRVEGTLWPSAARGIRKTTFAGELLESGTPHRLNAITADACGLRRIAAS